MPGAARRGVSNHQLVYMFELFDQKLRACGLPPHEAERQAMFCTLRIAGLTTAEARRDVDEIFPDEKGP